MRNCCSVCDGRLQIWERVGDRVDHPSCRFKGTAMKPVPSASYPKSPFTAITIAPRGELGMGFKNVTALPGTEGAVVSAT